MPNISKPCHNCRRRRLRCDRSWPSCHKCAVSGQECLGYGKVFVWTQGIDAHGNLKPSPGRNRQGAEGGGESATARVAPAHGRNWTANENVAEEQREWDDDEEEARVFHDGGGQGLSLRLGFGAHGRSHQPHYLLQHQSQYPGATSAATSASTSSLASSEYSSLTSLTSLASLASSSAFSSLPQRHSTSYDTRQGEQPPPEAVLGRLTDPVFQDLDRNSRYYLAHFADRVCKDLVARDAPGCNPFRELIPLTNRHPLLLQVIIATSAIHWSNIFRPRTAIPSGLSDPGGYLALLRSKDLVSRQALIDALTAKQKAMGHLREVLDTLDPAGSEVALAAMHFFIKFDLIDLDQSDAKSWKAHLEGASSILALLTPESANGASSRMLRDCVIADCFIYHILGSTLASGGIAARIARYAFELLPVMKRVEVNSYLSCPPEILQIILVASQLSYERPCTDWSLSSADEALALIDQALTFDVPAWARRLQRLSNVGDIESRVHVASAHRSAACLYIIQALPLVRTLRPVDTAFLVRDILSHLAQIGEDDPYFKATSWPTFIAGAETRDAEMRTWSLKRLLTIWEIIPWGYIFTAIEMLKATWRLQDAGGREGDGLGVNWLQDLRGMGFDYLIV